MNFYVLPVHAAQALGVRVDQVNLPGSGYGVCGDAPWVDPRFIEIRRRRVAVAAQTAEHRVNAELHRTQRTPEEVKLDKRKARKAARKARLKAMRAAAASVV